MKHDPQLQQMRDDWIGRQREHGNQPRAVLMKGLHPLINETIDRWHRQVMRSAFAGEMGAASGRPSLDVGCGYGRLADEAHRCGMSSVVGLDFTQQFCVDFQRHHGPAVCGGLSNLPFRDAAFGSAYSVTALMYLPVEEAQRALQELDRCLVAGSRVLLLEPCREFNSLVRMVLRKKRNETLSRPGFSLTEMRDTLPPATWRRTAAGSSRWMTALLPMLVACARFPTLYALLGKLALRLDRPAPGACGLHGKFSMYRWAVYQKT